MGRKHNEDGAIVVEATMALPVYMFLIVTILTIVNMCYVQAKIQIALNTAAKQVSQCMYIYYATGVSDAMNSGGGTSSATTGEISGFITDLLSYLKIENETLNDFTEALGGTSLAVMLENKGAETILEPIVDNVLKNSEEDSADAFYKRRGIVSHEYHAQLTGENNRTLILGMSYDLQLIRLFDIDFTIEMFNVVRTGMWGNTE